MMNQIGKEINQLKNSGRSQILDTRSSTTINKDVLNKNLTFNFQSWGSESQYTKHNTIPGFNAARRSSIYQPVRWP